MFKEFIASPPPIEKLTFLQKSMAPGKAQSAEQGLDGSTNYQTYFARWQPNARYIYQGLPLDLEFSRATNWFGISIFGRDHWRISDDGEVALWHDTGVPLRGRERNDIEPMAIFLTYRLAEVLNMGLYSLDIGTVRWSGNSFSQLNLKRGFKIDGDLLVSAYGVPTELNVRYTSATNCRVFKVLYSFERDTGVSFIPSEIRSTQSSNGKTLERFWVSIDSIKLADQPFEQSAFKPLTNLLRSPVRMRYYTNGYHYALVNGRLVRSPTMRSWKPSLEKGRPTYLAISVLFSAGIFILLCGIKKQEKQTVLFPEHKER